ncbi:insulin receptor substrate 2-like [Anguilla rostrata]|uniref:insulin receptor substrate 2-like n=1 Tax=Anguilla rostrata TaxID=7938 RepID=UPI0030CB4812
MASPPTTVGPLFSNANINNNKNVKKCGYLKKQKHGHKRFFVLKEQSEGFPARLEYYENEKKWKNKSAAKRVIPLDSCLNINKRADAKHKHLIALYTKDEYFAVAADNEQEQEAWYGVLTDLMNEGRPYDGSASNSASSLVGFEEANYGMITPVNAVYKEVWQVNLKARGLGQIKNVTGVYRLCLSSRTISFVKLNSEVAAVILQLMNIRRCGHSENFFFIEVGRSASTGPGELWMQADDSVVAQNIHETILEAMKAMKELSEFRPRSKSQSSGTNPISVPTRRHLNNLPPSQTGLLRRSRTDSMAATSPVSKFTSCRIRTASEGDSTMARPVSVNGGSVSPSASRIHLNRSNTINARPCRVFESLPLQHSKSMSISPVNLSYSSGNGPAPETIQRPSSDSTSVSGSPSDGGFLSCEDCASSSGDARHHLANGSNTPESVADTPPSHDGGGGGSHGDLYGYMLMERLSGGRGHRLSCLDEAPDSVSAYRKRTYSLNTPPQQRAATQVSSASLDEYTLMRATYASDRSGRSSHTASPKIVYPEDYGDVEIGSLRSSSSNLGDDGYMPMTPGAPPPGGRGEDYVPMSPMCVSAPKQIVKPRLSMADPPSSGSLEDSGYVRMWCGSGAEGNLANGEYMSMSPGEPCVSLTPPEPPRPPPAPPQAFGSLPRPCKPPSEDDDGGGQYVMMTPQSAKSGEEPRCCRAPSPGSTAAALPGRQGRKEPLLSRVRASRPTRLSLEAVRTLPSMHEHPLPAEPKSPGEYINIDFGEPSHASPPSSSLGQLSDYMNVALNVSVPPGSGSAAAGAPEAGGSERQAAAEGRPAAQVDSAHRPDAARSDYAEMDLRIGARSAEGGQTGCAAPGGGQRLPLPEQGLRGLEAFLLPASPAHPDRGAKVIRADPQGRRRHSSETFSSTTTVTPVCPSFAYDPRRHGSASVENVSVHNGEAPDPEPGSPMCRQTSAGFQNGLNYIALNLMDGGSLGTCETQARFKAASHCKSSINGIHATAYVSLGFKEAVTTVKD